MMLSKALTFKYLWSEHSTDETITSAITSASNEFEKEYLTILRDYRLKLTANNPRYNPAEACDVLVNQLLVLNDKIPQEPEQNELRAAVLNLLGLIAHKMQKDLKAAKAHFATALGVGFEAEDVDNYAIDKSKLEPLSAACILANLSIMHLDTEDEQAAVHLVTLIEKLLPDINPQGQSEVEERRILATVLTNVAIVMSKVKNRLALDYFNKAMQLWPEYNVIANNAAIHLSKLNMDSNEGLLASEAILAKFYDDAVKNNKFVTLYYRGNVNIKLANYAKSSEEKTAFLLQSFECLVHAERALQHERDGGNKDYSDSYRLMSTARLSYQRCLRSGVEGDKESAINYRKLAIEQRDAVPFSSIETQAKKDKFKAKMDFVLEPEFIQGFHVAMHPNAMFRPVKAVQAHVATVADEKLLSVTNRP
jgi:hypothetical protein